MDLFWMAYYWKDICIGDFGGGAYFQGTLLAEFYGILSLHKVSPDIYQGDLDAIATEGVCNRISRVTKKHRRRKRSRQ